jgi:hypothetical protein
MRRWDQKDIVIFFQLEFPAGFMAERPVPSNSCYLRWKRTSLEQVGNALLVIRSAVKVNSQQNGMILVAILAVNRNIVRRHWNFCLA